MISVPHPEGRHRHQVNLLRTFAEQLTRSVEQLNALREVGHAVSSSLDLETVLKHAGAGARRPTWDLVAQEL